MKFAYGCRNLCDVYSSHLSSTRANSSYQWPSTRGGWYNGISSCALLVLTYWQYRQMHTYRLPTRPGPSMESSYGNTRGLVVVVLGDSRSWWHVHVCNKLQVIVLILVLHAPVNSGWRPWDLLLPHSVPVERGTWLLPPEVGCHCPRLLLPVERGSSLWLSGLSHVLPVSPLLALGPFSRFLCNRDVGILSVCCFDLWRVLKCIKID